jgi:hypothetical protein
MSVDTCETEPMAKSPPERTTLLNLKGSEKEKAVLDEAVRKTGVPLSEIARRGMVMWLTKRGVKVPPDWEKE